MSRELRAGENLFIDGLMYHVSKDPNIVQGPGVINLEEQIKVVSAGDLIATTGYVRYHDHIHRFYIV